MASWSTWFCSYRSFQVNLVPGEMIDAQETTQNSDGHFEMWVVFIHRIRIEIERFSDPLTSLFILYERSSTLSLIECIRFDTSLQSYSWYTMYQCYRQWLNRDRTMPTMFSKWAAVHRSPMRKSDRPSTHAASHRARLLDAHWTVLKIQHRIPVGRKEASTHRRRFVFQLAASSVDLPTEQA